MHLTRTKIPNEAIRNADSLKHTDSPKERETEKQKPRNRDTQTSSVRDKCGPALKYAVSPIIGCNK